MIERTIAAGTHGRYLIEPPASSGPAPVLVGFHGYAEGADAQLARMRRIPGADRWLLVAIQGLHRFYRRRVNQVVASWMTRQDRELIVGDNVAYVDAGIAQAAAGRAIERLAFCGFSQGVAMAFRAGLLGRRKADAVVALGGDVPPELLADRAITFPRVLLARGIRDEWYTDTKLLDDETHLRARDVHVETLTFDGAHEWHESFARRAAALLATL